MATKNLLIRGGADFSSMRKELAKAQQSLTNFKTNVASTMKGIGVALASVGGALMLGSSIKEAAAFEAKMTTLSESLGASIKDFEKWQETVGRSLGFSKVQAADLANILSLNFKQFATSQQDLLDKTTKMMEVAAVVANKRGMAMSEVSDRIRSAMNQEADGADELGVNVRVAAITASNAYKEMANGAPWEQLSTSMQKAILYHHILEQVSTNLGMTIQDTTAMRISVFTAALSDLRLALGQAFLPIIHTVLPILTAFIGKITGALNVVAQFMRALFGIAPAQKQQTNAISQQTAAVGGLGDAYKQVGKNAEKAAKKVKGSVAGFDEINQLADPPSAASSGSGGGTGGGVGGGGISGGIPGEMAQTEGVFGEVSKKIQEFAAKVREKLKPMFDYFKRGWAIVSDYFKEKVNDMKKFWSEYGDDFIKAAKKAWTLFKPIWDFLVDYIWTNIKHVIDGVIKVFQGLIKFFSGVFNGDWKLAWNGLKDIVFGAVEAIWGFLSLSLFGTIKTGLLNLVKFFKSSFDDIVVKIKDPLKNIGTWFKDKGTSMWTSMKSGFTSVSEWFKTNVLNKITSVFSNAGNSFKTIGKTIWNGLKSSFTGVYSWFKTNVSDKISSAFRSISTSFKNIITAGVKTVLNGAINNINNVISTINSVTNKIPGISKLPDIPRIPRLARGGIVDGATNFGNFIAGEAGAEMVVPLENTSFVDKLAYALGTAVSNAMSNNSNGGDIVLKVNDIELGRAAAKGINKAQRVNGSMLLEI